MSMSYTAKADFESPSKQLVSTKSLLSELTRLKCRFRQRGSHITFHNDEADVRGTIVSGTKKLWSQKTVAEAREKIERYKESLLYNFQDASATMATDKAKQKNERSGIFVADNVPDTVIAEPSENNPDKLILRLAEYPQIGIEIPVFAHQHTFDYSLAMLETQKGEMKDALELLEVMGDCNIAREDDDIVITHSILDLKVILHPYDPGQTYTAMNAIDACMDFLYDAEATRDLMQNFLMSRQITKSYDQEAGAAVTKFHCNPFQGRFGRHIKIAMSQNGYVRENDLINFIDEADKIFFDEINVVIRKHYGFTAEKNGGEIIARHELLDDLSFQYPNFDKLPTLSSVLRKKHELTRDEYIGQLNAILDKREAILELVSYGLIFATEQIGSRSLLFNQCMDLMASLTKIAQDREPLGASISAKKLNRKLGRIARSAKQEFGIADQKSENPVSTISNQSFSHDFPFGKTLSVKVATPGDPLHISYMAIKPQGSVLFVVSQGMLEKLQGSLQRACAELGIDSEEALPDHKQLRDTLNMVFASMTPADPRGKPLGLRHFET